jgi:hypothetical protein
MGFARGRIPMTNVQGVPQVTGGSLPAAIWRAFMTALPAPRGSLGSGSSIVGVPSSSAGVEAEPQGETPSEADSREDPVAEDSPPPPPEEGGEEPGILPDVIPTPGSPPGT